MKYIISHTYCPTNTQKNREYMMCVDIDIKKNNIAWRVDKDKTLADKFSNLLTVRFIIRECIKLNQEDEKQGYVPDFLPDFKIHII